MKITSDPIRRTNDISAACPNTVETDFKFFYSTIFNWNTESRFLTQKMRANAAVYSY